MSYFEYLIFIKHAEADFEYFIVIKPAEAAHWPWRTDTRWE